MIFTWKRPSLVTCVVGDRSEESDWLVGDMLLMDRLLVSPDITQASHSLSTHAHPDTHTHTHTHTSTYATANRHTLLSRLNTPSHCLSSHTHTVTGNTHMMGCAESTLKSERSLSSIHSHAGFQEHSYLSKTSAAITPYSPVLQTPYGSARHIYCQSLKLTTSQCRQESTFMLL